MNRAERPRAADAAFRAGGFDDEMSAETGDETGGGMRSADWEASAGEAGLPLEGPAGRPAGQGAPVLSTPDWEGPLALLLDEARRRRVDLRRISLADLVEACLAAFASIGPVAARADQIGLAAELALMKSRLLLPEPAAEEADEAARLRRRLERLAAVRKLADALEAGAADGRARFGRGEGPAAGGAELTDAFGREADGDAGGDPAPSAIEAAIDAGRDSGTLDLLTLVRTYAQLRLRAEPDPPLALRRILAMTMGEALPLVEDAAAAGRGDWVGLFGAVGEVARERRVEADPRSVAAASFVAALEMAKRGEVEVKAEGEGVVVRNMRLREPFSA